MTLKSSFRWYVQMAKLTLPAFANIWRQPERAFRSIPSISIFKNRLFCGLSLKKVSNETLFSSSLSLTNFFMIVTLSFHGSKVLFKASIQSSEHSKRYTCFTCSIAIKDILESFIDDDLRLDIKDQFLRDTRDRPNYEMLRLENCEKLTDNGFLKAIWLILSEGFIASSMNVEKLIEYEEKI